MGLKMTDGTMAADHDARHHVISKLVSGFEEDRRDHGAWHHLTFKSVNGYEDDRRDMQTDKGSSSRL